MIEVQQALANIGIPVMAAIWRQTDSDVYSPSQYVIYSSTTTEEQHWDDEVRSYKTFVYMNLWSDIDPTDMASTIREAMYAAGFFIVEESDKGYNMPAYDAATRNYTVQWTWCYRKARMEVVPNANDSP